MNQFVRDAQVLDEIADSLCSYNDDVSVGHVLATSAWRVADICLSIRIAACIESGDDGSIPGISEPTANGSVLQPKHRGGQKSEYALSKFHGVATEDKGRVASDLRSTAALLRRYKDCGAAAVVAPVIADVGLEFRRLMELGVANGSVSTGLAGFDVPTISGAVLPLSSSDRKTWLSRTGTVAMRCAEKSPCLAWRALKIIVPSLWEHVFSQPRRVVGGGVLVAAAILIEWAHRHWAEIVSIWDVLPSLLVAGLLILFGVLLICSAIYFGLKRLLFS